MLRRAAPLVPEGYRYFTTWDTEGSQTRRVSPDQLSGGTTAGGVVPVRPTAGRGIPDSGAETAFPV